MYSPLILLAYEGWAQEQLLNTLREIEEPPARAIRFLGHVVAARRIWLGRIEDDLELLSTPIWPDWNVDLISSKGMEIIARWTKLVETWGVLPERTVTYKTLAGEPFSNALPEIFMHVYTHGTHHRGQVSLLLRDSGVTPPKTDLIYYLRKPA